ncbi:MAG: 6-phosphogluconate dehydratase [Candidatus Electronema aureum]|uniref:Phosphogluconate dehydratase n=1 Tax=Candidatus Electronema aureum TaxID=2005002 RepID=A0A521G0U8_9BACT|nr:MAG: 6-phosphogluconate dehydratase [Candidatus Electronema aureum]
MNKTVQRVTQRIIERSKSSRESYLARMAAAKGSVPFRKQLSCSNFAHDLAGCPSCRPALLDEKTPNIAIISAYNDVVSAHQPLGRYPALIKQAVAEAGGTAQFAGGVPAMCDGITQGEPGMDLSLMSRDVIALATVIALSHNVFDGALLLGVCDKIVPGLLMGGLQYGHLPMLLVPAGPMTSGIGNREKNQVRERFAKGEATHEELLASELQAYHSPGTCTFYGTANSNQLMAEMLGLHLPGASFVNAETPLRDALTKAAATRITALTHLGKEYTPLAEVISEKAVVNAMVGLLATGGSTNETMHLVGIAKAAGILINWDDFAELSDAVPLLVRIYPNGAGDINSFQQAGGMALLIRELLTGGFLHEDVQTVAGPGFSRYMEEPVLAGEEVVWQAGPEQSRDISIVAPLAKPFAQVSGIKVLSGNLGRMIMKISALADGENTCVEAPAMVFSSQHELEQAFKDGRMNRDLVAVLRFQGPRANGMPELHKLITFLSILMDQGHKVGLVTDGRLSGASGKVPFAIHCTPEALAGGLIAKVQDGDLIRMDARNNLLELKVSQEILAERQPASPPPESTAPGHGIFAALRRVLSGAEEGASAIL